MLRNYLKIALRNSRRQKVHFIINLTGLAIGMSACLMLFLWVQDEWSYDRFHKKADRIYRVTSQYEADGVINQSAMTPAPLGPALAAEFPAVEKVVRFADNGFTVSVGDKCSEERVFFADSTIFDIFTIPLVLGDPRSALASPDSIVISETVKDKFFGNENPVGKTISIKNLHDYTITGVFKNIPRNSHFHFELLGCFQDYAGKDLDQWGMRNYYTYILTNPNYPDPLHLFEKNMPQFIKKYEGAEAVQIYKSKYPLQALTSIHLHSHLRGEIQANGDIRNIYIFSAIAFFILMIACLNYINLAAAMYIKRAKEVVLRKVFGAFRSQLIQQFLAEGFLLSLFALPAALLMTYDFLPIFNSISGKELTISFFHNSFLLPGFIVMILFVGFFSGFFPALFLFDLPILQTISGKYKPGSKINRLRKYLVVFQFTISIVFIIIALTILSQLNFISKRYIGFNKDNIINIPINQNTAREKYETIKTELLRETGVRAITASTFSPGKNYWSNNYWYEGLHPNANPMIDLVIVDHDFIAAYGIKLVEGRDFSRNYPVDIEGSYILNQAAVKEIGWKSATGKKFKLGFAEEGSVIGVVEDFHCRSLHHEIKPLVLYLYPKMFTHFSLRLEPGNISRTLASINNKWKKIVPDQAFSYTFLDDEMNAVYQTEARLGTLFLAVSGLSVLIACLGLFALAAFTTEQRTKEIGIRKILGASSTGIIIWLSKQFSYWILTANLIAWPIAFYIAQRWLQTFAYRVGFEIWTFLLAGGGIFLVAMLTLGYKVISAASEDPVKALRYE